MLAGVFGKAQFWPRSAAMPINAGQTLLPNHTTDGMKGQPTNAKWAAKDKFFAATLNPRRNE